VKDTGSEGVGVCVQDDGLGGAFGAGVRREARGKVVELCIVLVPGGARLRFHSNLRARIDESLDLWNLRGQVKE